MAWNPSPQVAVLRDMAQKFNYTRVVALCINDATGEFQTVSFGITKERCAEAKKTADSIYNEVVDGLLP